MNPTAKSPDESTYSGRLAVRLRKFRERAGLSVEQAVELIEKHGYPIRVPTYYAWENGRRQANWDAVPAICKAFRVKPAELVPEK